MRIAMQAPSALRLFEACPPPCPVIHALDVLGRIAEALEDVHREAAHGDITPDRVLVTRDGERVVVRVTPRPDGVRNAAGIDGTVHYLAPERAGGAPPTVGSDLYALGVIAFQLLTGKLPFDGGAVDVINAHVYDEPPNVADVLGEPVDPAIEALVARALEKNPALRHKSAAAFRYEIATVIEGLATEQRRLRTSTMIKPENTRNATILLMFEHSALPQALVSASGEITVANRAFTRHVRADEGVAIADTSLAEELPELLSKLRWVQRHSTPVRLRTETMSAWIAPFSSEAVHLIVLTER